jgi:hypothetical protein
MNTTPSAIIQTLTVEEARFLAPNGLIPDDGLLQKLARRNLVFPLESKCRYRDGVFEILVEPDDFQKTTDAIQSHLVSRRSVGRMRSAGMDLGLKFASEPIRSTPRLSSGKRRWRVSLKPGFQQLSTRLFRVPSLRWNTTEKPSASWLS